MVVGRHSFILLSRYGYYNWNDRRILPTPASLLLLDVLHAMKNWREEEDRFPQYWQDAWEENLFLYDKKQLSLT